MRNQIFLFSFSSFLLLFSTIACGKPKTDAVPLVVASASSSSASPAPSTITSADPTATSLPLPTRTMQVVTADLLPTDIKVPGKITRAVRWLDENGTNHVIFSIQHATKNDKATGEKLESAYLNVEHTVLPHGGPMDNVPAPKRRSLRTIKDKVENCDADLTASFRDKALTVTDLDNDNYGEVTFAYVLNCTTDVSPGTLKVLMLENGEKYILRGQTRIDFGKDNGGAVGGEFQIDPSFTSAGAPPAFLEHAKKQWRAVRTEKF